MTHPGVDIHTVRVRHAATRVAANQLVGGVIPEFARVKSHARVAAQHALRSLPGPLQKRIRRHRNRTRQLPRMSIGLLSGDTPWTLTEDPSTASPIITAETVTDCRAAFVADPFAMRVGDVWNLYFEVMNQDTGKGEIGLATSVDLRSWEYGGLVLVEPFHLSYPAVYFVDGEYWMVPESWESGQVRLYRATDFPRGWKLDTVLVDGVSGTDPTLYRHDDGSWSMLLCEAGRRHNETLWRYDSPALRGPWQLAAESPLVHEDASRSRPGGHVFTFADQRYRMAQNCSQRYGEALRSFPLEAPWTAGGMDVLVPTGAGWRGLGGHHADLHPDVHGGVLAFVDGEC